MILMIELFTVTTPLKETLDPKITLLEAKFVPCVHIHFKWIEEEANARYLKEEIYSKTTSSDAASILASKYRYLVILETLYRCMLI